MKTIQSRQYIDESDYIAMRAMLMEARALTSDWRYAHVGELAFNYFMVLIHLDPRQHIRLWFDGPKLVGFAMLSEDPNIDWQILPGYEWQGIEAEALVWAETYLAELRRKDEKKWGGALGSGSRQDNPERIAFLEKNGFSYCGRFAEVNMIRSLDQPIPEACLPAGYVVRELMETGEVPARAEAERAVWLPWSVGEISDADYARLMQMPGYQRDLDVVTVAPDGVIAAYVLGWLDPVNKIGDFGPVGAVTPYRRQGLTRAAQYEGLRRMKALGMERVCISTGIANTPARNLYESVGFKIVNRYLDYTKPNPKPSVL
ncbi:MAG TPA: GNAT family N-acetyltransferase [Anaerolineaceae bacterium]|nr:GNAT family N-acetyltransferase [Anaerolineaceae bacterium]